MKSKQTQYRKGEATMQAPNFVAVMAILNAMVQRFNDDTVKTNIATLGRPFGTSDSENASGLDDAKRM
jgi:hypothetical protein